VDRWAVDNSGESSADDALCCDAPPPMPTSHFQRSDGTSPLSVSTPTKSLHAHTMPAAKTLSDNKIAKKQTQSPTHRYRTMSSLV
jgi:hypothetical protein